MNRSSPTNSAGEAHFYHSRTMPLFILKSKLTTRHHPFDVAADKCNGCGNLNFYYYLVPGGM